MHSDLCFLQIVLSRILVVLFMCTGTHFGMEKTKEQVSSQYYWMGITYSVRNTVHTCLSCSSRSKTIGPTFSFNTGSKTITPASTTTPVSAIAWEGGDEAAGDGDDSADVGDLTEGGDGASDLTFSAPTLVKQELEKQAADVFFVAKDICSHFWQKVFPFFCCFFLFAIFTLPVCPSIWGLGWGKVFCHTRQQSSFNNIK